VGAAERTFGGRGHYCRDYVRCFDINLSHIIAGSAEAAYMVLRGDASVADYLGRFFAPTLLGNVVGGVALVGMVNRASIAPEMSGRGSP